MSGETVDQDNPSRLKPRETRQLLSPDLEEYDEYNALVDEIRERLDWLDEMKELGAGKKYESQIRSEVSLRMSRLEQLQRRSTTETSKKEGPGIYT
ncbi:hypothetical protein BKA69DRAFT_14504 [Paraphysoderma sedebokerense]|nr:hypothetical protein BKA69DRAFT_14504 [Paraphysoderma sedebokerense]